MRKDEPENVMATLAIIALETDDPALKTAALDRIQYAHSVRSLKKYENHSSEKEADRAIQGLSH